MATVAATAIIASFSAHRPSTNSSPFVSEGSVTVELGKPVNPFVVRPGLLRVVVGVHELFGLGEVLGVCADGHAVG